MTLFTLAERVEADALRTALAPHVPSHWELMAETTGGGALATAGVGFGNSSSWLVCGAPVDHPWGAPGAPRRPLDAVAAHFDRYGPAAVQLVAGPVVALDLSAGTVVRAINGIVPAFYSASGPWVVATSAAAVSAVSGEGALALPPGSAVGPDRVVTSWAANMPDGHETRAPWKWIETESDAAATAHPAPADAAVFLPRLAPFARDKRSWQRYASLRNELPRRWWEARLKGRWLYAPAFERPALDVILMLREQAAA